MTASYDTIAADSGVLDRLSERRCIIHNGVVGLRISARRTLANVEAIFQGPSPRVMEDGRNISSRALPRGSWRTDGTAISPFHGSAR